jgi:hypothetical protein
MLPTKDPSEPKFSILGFTDGKTPNTRIVMAAAGLKVTVVAESGDEPLAILAPSAAAPSRRFRWPRMSSAKTV